MERPLIFVISFFLGFLTGYAAKANQDMPPTEYDHPFNGTMQIYSGDRAYVWAECSKIYRESGSQMTTYPTSILGCSRVENGGSVCHVILYDEDPYFTPQMILRHETAHCNGYLHE